MCSTAFTFLREWVNACCAELSSLRRQLSRQLERDHRCAAQANAVFFAVQ
jgi:hypothetical protein